MLGQDFCAVFDPLSWRQWKFILPLVYLLRFLIKRILAKDNGEIKIPPIHLFLKDREEFGALIGITVYLPHIRLGVF